MTALNYLEEIWERSHKKIKEDNCYRTLYPFPQNNTAINFSSNDYLGLRHDLRICAAGTQAARVSGAGSGSSRSVLQSDSLIENLENYFCENAGFKHALFLPSGFVANVTFFDVLNSFAFEEINQEFFIDHRCHASIFFSLKNNTFRSSIFKHNDLNHLEKKLSISQAKAKIIVIESLFSMDGDFFQANELSLLCEKYNALIFVDESHSFGIYGKNGAGWVNESPHLKKHIIAATFGCGKAVGVSGGFFATNSLLLKERILQKSKLFIYSTGISPFISGAVYESLQIIFSPEGQEKRKILFENINYLFSNLKEIHFQFPLILERKRQSQIFPLIFYSNELTVKISNYLIENHIFAKAIRPPSVPHHTSRLRISLSAAHTKNDMDKFIFNLNKVLTP